MAVSSNFEIYTTVGLAYLDGDYQEQGMSDRTNPILAAYARSPFLSPYKKNDDGSVTPSTPTTVTASARTWTSP